MRVFIRGGAVRPWINLSGYIRVPFRTPLRRGMARDPAGLIAIRPRINPDGRYGRPFGRPYDVGCSGIPCHLVIAWPAQRWHLRMMRNQQAVQSRWVLPYYGETARRDDDDCAQVRWPACSDGGTK